MNTPAHLLLGVAICSRRTARRTGVSAALGSLAPDLSLYVLAGVSLAILQIPADRVFGELYFSPAWQAVFAIDNSFVIWGGGFLAMLALRSLPGIAFTSAGLVHLATDFPLHHDDARPQFWPVSDWVFESPVSYWDSLHHAGWVAPFTVLVVLISAFVIWRRWPNWGIRIAILAACLLELWVVRQWLLFF